jgi:hypothetical protein
MLLFANVLALIGFYVTVAAFVFQLIYVHIPIGGAALPCRPL